MTDSALDFLLEHMTQLMNSSEKLIVNDHQKEQMEWVYEEMKFLRQFLKDSEGVREELKQLVAKIRDVTYQVDDIIDSFVLINTCWEIMNIDGYDGCSAYLDRPPAIGEGKWMYGKCVHQAQKINNGCKLLMEYIDCIKMISKTEMMEITSSLESQGIHHYCMMPQLSHKPLPSMEIFLCPNCHIRQVTESSFRRLQSFSELRLLRSLSDKVVYWHKKDPNPFLGIKMYSQIPCSVPLLFSRINYMVNLAKKIHHQFGGIIQELKPIAMRVERIYERKGLSVRRPPFHMPNRVQLLFNLVQQMINLSEEIDSEFCGVMEESKTINTKEMEALRCRIIQLMLPTLAYVNRHQDLGDVMKDIKSIKREVMEIYEKKMYGIGEGVRQITTSSHKVSSKTANPIAVEETVLGFDDEISTIMELLTGEHQKGLQNLPIIGMPGLGKTTLARKVYNDPFIVYYFHIRAWTFVSQVYQKREILLSIINSAGIHVLGNTRYMSDEELGEHIYKALKGKRYLVVMDDIWSIKAWDDVKIYFPNDRNGSRIVFTSRLVNVAMALHPKPHYLRFLNEDESWNLLCLKAFGKESCPMDLIEIGKQIAKKCGGLPLAIAVVSGLLAKTDKKEEWWRHVSKSVSSYIIRAPEEYMDTLALSYNHLPQQLKPCFLYFGAFPEDYEIPVRQLIWLWVAEGFIRQNEQKSLEEVAEDYLMDLFDRGLIIISKKRSNGGIKACHVHDLLRDLCLRKATEDNFLRQIFRYEQNSAYKQRRLCIHDNLDGNTSFKPQEVCIRYFLSFGHSFYDLPVIRDVSFIWKAFMFLLVLNLPSIKNRLCFPLENFVHLRYIALDGNTSFKPHEVCIRSFLSFGHSFSDLPVIRDVSFIWKAFMLLRVLNLLSIKIRLCLPLENLAHLRYIALNVEQEEEQELKPSISNLLNLETIIINGPKGSLDLYDIWKLVNLRHVCSTRPIQIHGEILDVSPSVLDNLKTIGKLHGGHALARFPNLQKLKCQHDGFPKLDFLVHLETLNLIYSGYTRFSLLDRFPPNLKSLTLSKFRLPWDQMSTLGSLPNLEVLKLSYKAFEGPTWNTSDGEFRKLRFLKFRGLDIRQWNISSNHFASIQTLVLEDCPLLEEIPCSLADLSTLEVIQVRWCSCPAEDSARRIQEKQQLIGNDSLKVLIYYLNHNEDEDGDE